MEILRKWFPHADQRRRPECLEWRPKAAYYRAPFERYYACVQCRTTIYCPGCKQRLPQQHFELDARDPNYHKNHYEYCNYCRAEMKAIRLKQQKENKENK